MKMNRNDFRKCAEKRLIRLDGATGTELAKRGMPSGVSPELWVCEHPEALHSLHRAYREAGSELLLVPSFGGNELKLSEFGLAGRAAEINTRLAEIAREGAGDALCFGDISSTGQLLSPAGKLDFEECVAVFRRQAEALISGGVDGFTVETMMDLSEARAALIAIRDIDNTLPVIVTMTFEAGGRTLTGNTPLAALIALQELGADAFGCNCSTGPAAMAEVIRELRPYAKIPLAAKPNAGMPHLTQEGKTVFDLDPHQFAAEASALVDAGASLIGGCCGTTPEHIAALTAATANRAPAPHYAPLRGVISSGSRIVRPACQARTLLIGERINPTGKKAFQAALRAGDFAAVLTFACEQETAGADLLDVNFGLAGIDETAFLRRAADELPATTQLPLCFDTTNAASAEAALRRYPGRALFNSISAESGRIRDLLPVVARYGALPILLPLTDAGIPETIAERKAVLHTLQEAVEKCGRDPREVLADALILTAGANPEAPRLSLDFIEYCTKELEIATVCGLSNVSFGLPCRPEWNRSFFALAQSHGLAAVIANPGAPGIVEQLISGDALLGRDDRMERALPYFSAKNAAAAPAAPAPEKTEKPDLYDAVLRGRQQEIPALLEKSLAQGNTPAKIVNEMLIPALNTVGDRFGKKELFLPQLMQSAAAMQTAMEKLTPLLASGDDAAGPVIVFATVAGDIHDIGKNIVILLLRNHGFKVIDLGKDVAPEVIVDAVRKHGAALVALSALMTTTMPKMRETIELLRREKFEIPVMVGGAAVDAEFASSIGAAYSGDAAEAVKVAKALLNRG